MARIQGTQNGLRTEIRVMIRRLPVCAGRGHEGQVLCPPTRPPPAPHGGLLSWENTQGPSLERGPEGPERVGAQPVSALFGVRRKVFFSRLLLAQLSARPLVPWSPQPRRVRGLQQDPHPIEFWVSAPPARGAGPDLVAQPCVSCSARGSPGGRGPSHRGGTAAGTCVPGPALGRGNAAPAGLSAARVRAPGAGPQGRWCQRDPSGASGRGSIWCQLQAGALSGAGSGALWGPQGGGAEGRRARLLPPRRPDTNRSSAGGRPFCAPRQACPRSLPAGCQLSSVGGCLLLPAGTRVRPHGAFVKSDAPRGPGQPPGRTPETPAGPPRGAHPLPRGDKEGPSEGRRIVASGQQSPRRASDTEPSRSVSRAKSGRSRDSAAVNTSEGWDPSPRGKAGPHLPRGWGVASAGLTAHGRSEGP